MIRLSVGAPAPFEALENRVVLAVDRQQTHAVFAHRARHHLAGDHQHFLVGERDILAGLRSRASVGRSPSAPTIADITNSRRRMRRDRNRAVQPRAGSSTFSPPSRASSSRASFGVATETSSGLEAPHLLGQQFDDCARPPSRRRESAPGKRLTTSSVVTPTEPVEPRIAIVFIANRAQRDRSAQPGAAEAAQRHQREVMRIQW